MTERTLEEALALADEWRGHESVGEDVYTDLVLLADEVKRLRAQHAADVLLAKHDLPPHEHKFQRWTGTPNALCWCGAVIRAGEGPTTAAPA